MNKKIIIIGRLLKKQREKYGLSIRRLGEILNISHSEISRIERGLRLNPNIFILNKICSFLNIEPMNLINEAEKILRQEEKINKNYDVTVKKTKEIIIKVKAKDEEEAIKKVEDLLDNINIFELYLSRSLINYEVEESNFKI